MNARTDLESLVQPDADELEERRAELKLDAARLITETGILFVEEGSIKDMQLSVGEDVHGFYELGGSAPQYMSLSKRIGESVIHVQSYSDLATAKEVVVSARLMNKDKLIAARAAGQIPIGDEHATLATIIGRQRVSLSLFAPHSLKQRIEFGMSPFLLRANSNED